MTAPALDDAYLYTRLPALALAKHGARAKVFPVVHGEPLSLAQLRKLRTPVGTLLYAQRRNPLTDKLAAQGVTVLAHVPGLAQFLAHLELRSVAAAAMLHTATPVPLAGRDEELLTLARRLLDGAGCRLRALYLGDLAYLDSQIGGALLLRQQEAFGVSKGDEKPSLLGGARDIVLNVTHTLVARCRKLAERDLPLAAQFLAQGVGGVDGLPQADCSEIGRHALDHARSLAEGRGG